MKKITIITLFLSLLMCSCSDTNSLDSSYSAQTSADTPAKTANTSAPAGSEPDFINMHEFQPYKTSIRYNGISHPLNGYLIDESSYVFRLDDIANYFGLNVAFDDAGAISITGDLDIKPADYIPPLDMTKVSIDDRYTTAAIMSLSDAGIITFEYEENTAASYPDYTNNYSDSAYPSNNTSDITPPPPYDPDNPSFNFSSISDAGDIKAVDKDNKEILEDFELYNDVASKFYSRFYEIPNLTWAEDSASVIQILNHPDSASYWYYVPNETKENLEDSYATLLSAFGYKYAGSSNGYHTYTLNSNSVKFGYEGSDFVVNMSGLSKCNVGEEYANGFKSAGLTDFGKKFDINCNEELMYYGDWVYSYPAEDVNKTNAIPLYLNELEKEHFKYIGTLDGKSSYSNGNITIGMRTLDDNFYLSVIKE